MWEVRAGGAELETAIRMKRAYQTGVTVYLLSEYFRSFGYIPPQYRAALITLVEFL